MGAEEIHAVPLDYFVGAKSTFDREHVLLKCRSADGEFHIAIKFDQVIPLVSALLVEVDAKHAEAGGGPNVRKPRARRGTSN